MSKKIVTVTLTRTYYKTATIEVEVDENLKNEELKNFIINDVAIDTRLENAVSEDNLNGGDDVWEYSDPTNQDGGHL
jgi:hypothetical protein